MCNLQDFWHNGSNRPGETDNKIFCIPVADELNKKYLDIADLSEDKRKEYTAFWLEVARQKKKVMEILSFGNKKSALEEIKKSTISKKAV